MILHSFLNLGKRGKALLNQMGILPGAVDNRWTPIPNNLLFDRFSDTGGITFGLSNSLMSPFSVGIPQGMEEGHIATIGGSGSGKSTGIAIPTMKSYRGPMLILDIKGELSGLYSQMYSKGYVKRPFIIFDPKDPSSPSYDPFGCLDSDDKSNLNTSLYDIAVSLIPDSHSVTEPFWREASRVILQAGLRHYYLSDLSFSEALLEIVAKPWDEMSKYLKQNGDSVTRSMVEDYVKNGEMIGSLGAEARTKLAILATDPNVSHAFRGAREGAKCFTWEALEEKVIFLRIPADKIDAWSGMISLMYKQLFRYLERRPEKYSKEGRNCEQILLLMDEFPRLGRIEGMTSAMATLRSKGVTICLIIQSTAQLDEHFGENGRRIILDNCSYKVILGSNDPETQKALSDLAGTTPSLPWGAGVNLDRKVHIAGFNLQCNSSEKPFIQPHELAFLNDVILISPYGVYQIQKIQPSDLPQSMTVSECARIIFGIPEVKTIPKEVSMMSLEERTKQADKKLRTAETTQRKSQQNADKRRNFLVGAMFTKYFPSVKSLTPGSTAQNDEEFAELEAFFYLLSLDTDLLEDLKARAKGLCATDPNGDWRNSPSDEPPFSIPEESTYTSQDDSDLERGLTR